MPDWDSQPGYPVEKLAQGLSTKSLPIIEQVRVQIKMHTEEIERLKKIETILANNSEIQELLTLMRRVGI